MNENVEQTDVGKTHDLREAKGFIKAVGEISPEGDEQMTIEDERNDPVVADVVHGDIVHVDGGEVKNIQAETVQVQEGAILHVEAESVELQEGAIGMVRAGSVTLTEGAIGVAVAERIEVGEGAVLFAAAQEFGGETQVLFDLKAALIFGAVVGVVSGLVKALAGRKN
jgi:hypothetical protein